jgi:hypothetical protein
MSPNETSDRSQQWLVQEGGVYQPCGATIARLPAGAYTCTLNPYGLPVFQSRRLLLDDLIDFPDSLPARIIQEIDQFWKLGPGFRQYGFLHRRGYLLYGKQGGGKSSLIHQIIHRIVAAGQVAFFCEAPQVFIGCVQGFRAVEPDRPIVCIFEDIDALIAQYGDSDLLQWLDGNHQIDRAVNVASTNYPENLDRRIISRPRRFDRVYRIDAPDARMRAAYFARKLPELSPAERARWVQLSDGLPFAALAEMVISVVCLGNDLDRTVETLRQLDSHQPSSSEFNPPSLKIGVED